MEGGEGGGGGGGEVGGGGGGEKDFLFSVRSVINDNNSS